MILGDTTASPTTTAQAARRKIRKALDFLNAV